MSENKELDEALRKLETKHRAETFLMKIGASEEAAKLIASSPDQIKKFAWDGVNLTFNGSDLAAVDDPAAKAHFTDGPFQGLFFAPADKLNGDDHPQPDPALLAAARAGNRTAYSRLARDSFGGDVKALDAALTDKGDRNDKVANGHEDKPLLNGFEGSKNPFFKLRKPDGSIDKAVEKKIGELISVMGHKAVTDIAKAAKSPAAPMGLTLTGLPLRP
jgi:hypothetical protein